MPCNFIINYEYKDESGKVDINKYELQTKISKDIENKYLPIFNKIKDIENFKPHSNKIMNNVERVKAIEELLNNLNIDIVKSKEFINYYYWSTNLNLTQLIEKIAPEINNNSILIKNFVDKDQLEIIHPCNNCDAKLNYRPKNRTDRDNYIKGKGGGSYIRGTLCNKCKNQLKEEKIKKKEKLREEKLKEEEIKKGKLLKIENISSNIIVTKHKNNYIIKLENEEVTNKLSDKYINLIDEMLKINNLNTDEIYYENFTLKGKIFKKIMEKEDNINIINTTLFINIYIWLTNLPMHHLDSIIYGISNSNLKVINGDIYENVDNRHGSKFPNYLAFKSWLLNKYKNNNITFDCLFNNIENVFDISINTTEVENKDINVNYIQDQINNLKNMPYKEYLQTEHWREKRKSALYRANNKCQLCGNKENLHVHHNTYDNRGQEKDEDLVVLCEICHARHHGKLIEEKEESINEKQIEISNQIKTKLFISEINTEIDDNDLDSKINEYINKNNITNIISMQTNFNPNNLYSVLLVYSI